MKILFMPIVSAIAILMTGCYRPEVHNRIGDSQKQFYNFRPGTYWVLRDSLTGDMDSIVVTSFLDSEILISSHEVVYDEVLSINMAEYGGDSVHWTIGVKKYGGELQANAKYQFLLKYPQTAYNETHAGYCDSGHQKYNYTTKFSLIGDWKGHKKVYESVYLRDSSICAIGVDNHAFISDSGIIEIRRNDEIKRVWELQRCRIIR
jgi:hypothetical protein